MTWSLQPAGSSSADTGAHNERCISEARRQFIQALRGRGFTACTVQTYEAGARKLERFVQGRGVGRLQDVTATDMEAYRLHLVESGLATASVAFYLGAARRLFEFLEQRRSILLSPARALAPVRGPRRLMPVPTEEEIARLLNQQDTGTDMGVRSRALLELAYGTAARLQELADLATGDVGLEDGTARLMGKGRKQRLVPMGRHAATWMERYLKEARPRLLHGSVLSHERLRRMLDAMPADSAEAVRNRVMLEALYSSGVRAAELLGIDMGDVDFAHRTVMVTGKGEKQRVVPLGRTAARMLESYVRAVRPFQEPAAGERAVFLGRDGRRLSYAALRRIVRACADRAGLDGTVTAHTFRRSCATELIRGGANIYHVKELLGHESLGTLRHYARLTITDLKQTHAHCHPREADAREDGAAGPEDLMQ